MPAIASAFVSACRPARVCLLSCVLVAGCMPSLNWREVVPEGAHARLHLPCKPELHQRPASTQQPEMGLAQCEAAGLSFSLSWAQVPEPRMVSPALQAMRQALRGKLRPSAGAAALQAVSIQGLTPRAEHGWETLAGAHQSVRVAYVSRGLRVYQLTQMGARDDPAAFQQLMESLQLLD